MANLLLKKGCRFFKNFIQTPISRSIFVRFFSGKKQCLSQAVYFNISTSFDRTTPLTSIGNFLLSYWACWCLYRDGAYKKTRSNTGKVISYQNARSDTKASQRFSITYTRVGSRKYNYKSQVNMNFFVWVFEPRGIEHQIWKVNKCGIANMWLLTRKLVQIFLICTNVAFMTRAPENCEKQKNDEYPQGRPGSKW